MVGPSEKPQIWNHVQESEDEITPRKVLNRAGVPSPHRAQLDLLVFLLLAAWSIFTEDVYPQNAG